MAPSRGHVSSSPAWAARWLLVAGRLAYAADGELAVAEEEPDTPARFEGWGSLVKSPPVSREKDFDGLSFFVYELPGTYHEKLVDKFTEKAREAGSNCDFMLSPCTEHRWAGFVSSHRQFGAEVIILQKLLVSSARVLDPQLADFFVVPYLPATECRLGGYLPRCLHTVLVQELFRHLTYYNHATRHRHLFIATADIHSLPLVIQAQPLLASNGAYWGQHAGHLVVPPGVTEVEFQPGNFHDVDIEDRDILFWLAQTPNNAIRYVLQEQLIRLDRSYSEEERHRLFGLKGSIRMHVAGRSDDTEFKMPSPAEMVAEMERSLFCPAPPAENAAAGTKRFFDVLLAGCVPVVVTFQTVFGSGISWWRRDGAPIEWAMPFMWEIDWRRLVVEVPSEILTGTDPTELVALFSALSHEDMLAKRRYLLEVRGRLLYDLSGGTRDAFSLMMDGLRAMLPQLDSSSMVSALSAGAPFMAPPGEPLVCDSTPRMGEFRQLPIELSAEEGKEKAWMHTFGEVSCGPVRSWRSPQDYWNVSAFLTQQRSPLVVERFMTERMIRAPNGTAVSLQVLVTSAVAPDDERAVLSSVPFSVCSHWVFPNACHDFISVVDGSPTIQFCHDVPVVNLPPNSTCRLLPAPVPMQPRATLAPSPTIIWEAVTWACGVGRHLETIANEMEFQFVRQMPPRTELHVTIYEVCPDPYGGARFGTPPAGVLIEHLLGVIHEQRRGGSVPDAIVLMTDHWITHEWISPIEASQWTRPRHLMALLAARLGDLEEDGIPTPKHAKFARWLFAFDGPVGEYHSCEEYCQIFATKCAVTRGSMEGVTPQAVAFPTELLRSAVLSEWEVAASARTWQNAGQSDAFQGDSQNWFNLVYVMLMKTAEVFSKDTGEKYAFLHESDLKGNPDSPKSPLPLGAIMESRKVAFQAVRAAELARVKEAMAAAQSAEAKTSAKLGAAPGMSALFEAEAAAPEKLSTPVADEEFQACLEAFEKRPSDQGEASESSETQFVKLSGMPALWESNMLNQARNCVSTGAVYIVYNAGLPFNNEEWFEQWGREFSKEVDILLTALGPLEEEHWLELQAFGVCMPADHVCGLGSDRLLGWHYLLRHAFTVPEVLSKLPPPHEAHVRMRLNSPEMIDAVAASQIAMQEAEGRIAS